MSDFLTRLAQRQLSQIATIEPRVAPLYSEASEPADRSLAEETEYRPVFQKQETVVLHERKPLQESAPLSADVDDVESMPHKPLVSKHKASVDPMPRIEERPSTGESPFARREFLIREGSPIAVEKTSADQTTKDLSSKPETEETSARERLLFIPIVRTLPVAPAPLVKAMQSESTQRVSPFATPPVLAGQNQFRMQQHHTGEAPVHVTIGRIEVTAVTQSAPPKRNQETRKQTMSLDDYLARRQRRHP